MSLSRLGYHLRTNVKTFGNLIKRARKVAFGQLGLALIIMVLALRLPRLMYCAASAALVKVRPNLILQGGSKNNLFDIASLVLKNLHRSCGAGFFMAR